MYSRELHLQFRILIHISRVEYLNRCQRLPIPYTKTYTKIYNLMKDACDDSVYFASKYFHKNGILLSIFCLAIFLDFHVEINACIYAEHTILPQQYLNSVRCTKYTLLTRLKM